MVRRGAAGFDVVLGMALTLLEREQFAELSSRGIDGEAVLVAGSGGATAETFRGVPERRGPRISD